MERKSNVKDVNNSIKASKTEKTIKEVEAVKEEPKKVAAKATPKGRSTTSNKRTTTAKVLEDSAKTKESTAKPKSVSRGQTKKPLANKPEEKLKEVAKINYSELLGSSEIKVVIENTLKNSEKYPVKAVLKNLGFVKDVIVRYTVDGWENYLDEPLAFNVLDEETNIEEWIGEINLSDANKEKFQYAVSYQVNGIQYWDNNSANNYVF